jgi:hypothetical protein
LRKFSPDSSAGKPDFLLAIGASRVDAAARRIGGQPFGIPIRDMGGTPDILLKPARYNLKPSCHCCGFRFIAWWETIQL